MKFGPASPADALGGVTVHTLRQGSLVLKKGTTIGSAEVEALNKAGTLYRARGDIAQAEACHQQALDLALNGIRSTGLS